jgi:hypothetical protein
VVAADDEDGNLRLLEQLELFDHEQCGAEIASVIIKEVASHDQEIDLFLEAESHQFSSAARVASRTRSTGAPS